MNMKAKREPLEPSLADKKKVIRYINAINKIGTLWVEEVILHEARHIEIRRKVWNKHEGARHE